MTGRSTVSHTKDAVVSILAAFKERTPDNPPSARKSTAATPARDPATSVMVAHLPADCGLYRQVDGHFDLVGEAMTWRPDPAFSSALTRARTHSSAVFTVRNADGSPCALIVAEGQPLEVTYVSHRSSPMGIEFAEAIGKALVENGVSLGRAADRFNGIYDRGGEIHFIDGCPDRLELITDFSGNTGLHAELPKVLISQGDFFLMDSHIARNPVSANVKGTLGLAGNTGLILPSHLNVGVDLLVQMSDAERLPSRFSVGRDLNIAMTRVSEFPENFHVGRNIIANGSEIGSLRGGLSVKGDLDLRSCPIEEIPWGLAVTGTLNLAGTAVSKVSPDAVIGGNLMVEEGVVVPSTVRIGGRLMYARPYGYEAAPGRSH